MKYGLVMIVKDEATRIRACLESLRPHLSYWTILDTGSTDATEMVARAVLEGIPGGYHHGPFENFGSARSRAFALARWTAGWLIASDADMTWTIDPDWMPLPTVDAYMVDMGDGSGFSNWLPLILSGDRPWKSVGVVHEYTALSNGTLGRRERAARVHIRQPGAAWTEERGLANLALLEAADQRDPRTVFYLAQTHRDLGHRAEAISLYRRRVDMGDFEEERFCAAYAAAGLEEDWRIRFTALLGAWEMRPQRLEPLYDAVHLLNSMGAFETAYALVPKEARPCDDSLFVETAVWRWGVGYEAWIAARGSGRLAEALDRAGMLLASAELPEHIRAEVAATMAEAA